MQKFEDNFSFIEDIILLYMYVPCGSAGKESTCNVGDLGLIPGLGRSPGEGKGYPLQYSGLENSMDYTVHGVAKSWRGQSKFHSHATYDLTPNCSLTPVFPSSKVSMAKLVY